LNSNLNQYHILFVFVTCHKSIDCNLLKTILFVTSYKIEIKFCDFTQT